jgi:LmbE family N-acetylglucosaminyl deacetylase
MRRLGLARPGEALRILCLGAHSDDIEIGCGGTVLSWISSGVKVEATWCVLSALGPRASEARASANDFLDGATSSRVVLGQFEDGRFPSQGGELKDWFESLKKEVNPDVILTHRRDDAHQDHREISRLTWNTFRDHLILEYEIPKWDGDLGQPNLYQPLSADVLDRKIAFLLQHFGTQQLKDWFDAETFSALARLRGMESRSPDRVAEAFYLHKATIG